MSHDSTHALTRNQQMVHSALSGADKPLSAYEILDRLRADGFRAPPQVYRALDRLVTLGLAHRLESLNAYVACRHSCHAAHEDAVFAICDRCGEVAELEDKHLAADIGALADRAGFALKAASVELRGRCKDCRDA